HHREVIDVRSEHRYAGGAEQTDSGRDAEGEPAATSQKSAQAIERLDFGIFRNETPCRRRQAEVGERTNHQHPGPYIDVDAKLKAAHPAREQDLTGERKHRAADAHQKNLSGSEL